MFRIFLFILLNLLLTFIYLLVNFLEILIRIKFRRFGIISRRFFLLFYRYIFFLLLQDIPQFISFIRNFVLLFRLLEIVVIVITAWNLNLFYIFLWNVFINLVLVFTLRRWPVVRLLICVRLLTVLLLRALGILRGWNMWLIWRWGWNMWLLWRLFILLMGRWLFMCRRYLLYWLLLLNLFIITSIQVRIVFLHAIFRTISWFRNNLNIPISAWVHILLLLSNPFVKVSHTLINSFFFFFHSCQMLVFLHLFLSFIFLFLMLLSLLFFDFFLLLNYH